ncbi:protein alan shepard-like isoform X2 [Centruroides sculpturatus]|uniref:protein alan shepard-like isoform X2 n=1 Tax=Centruroides sculpturatus TaxID=218467 RepID=UPI000C6DC7D2|nr:protein alan shepard-like isoform X2 [Centruroides sculpturatus]
MAKQQEQDPTNLYIANLPPCMAETDLEGMLAPYGTVISTRILRDSNMQSRGVGFARMECKEKCEHIISTFNGNILQGSKEPLLVKFADGGNKRRNQYKNQEHRIWREGEGIPLTYEQSGMSQNGVAAQLVAPVPGYQRQYSTPVSSYPLQPGTAWVPQHQYIVQTPMHQVIPSSPLEHLHYSTVPQLAVPQLTAQMSQLHLSGTSYVAGTHPAYTGPAAPAALYPQHTPLVQPVPLSEDPISASVPVSGNNSGTEDQQHPYQAYTQAK